MGGTKLAFTSGMAEAKLRAEHERQALWHENQGQLLRDMAGGPPLPEILEKIVRSIETREPRRAGEGADKI